MDERFGGSEDAMHIEIKLSTGLKKYLPDPDATGSIRSLNIAERATVKDLLEELGIPTDTPKVIMINDRQGALEYQLVSGDRVTLFPPVGGG